MRVLFFVISTFLFFSCSKTLELDLPEYEDKLTVEFYLEDGKPIRCFLQESLKYTDERIINLVEGATVLLKYGNQVDTLQNRISIDSTFNKVFNYSIPKIFRVDRNLEYQLYVTDREGRELLATARASLPVKIDSTVVDFNDNGEARLGLVFNDPAQVVNYYRIVAFPADTVATEENTWSFILTDNAFNGQKFSFFTGYAFDKGRLVMARLYSLDKAHYDFEQSVSTARQSNFNPFGQPAPIVSNVIGGHGIFTVLNYDEVLMNIQ